MEEKILNLISILENKRDVSESKPEWDAYNLAIEGLYAILYRSLIPTVPPNGCDKLTIRCKDCNKYFALEEGEMKFYEKKELNYPKRCRACREKRKVKNNVKTESAENGSENR